MPPQLVLNREQLRRVDVLAVERFGMTGLVLMENAGRGAAEIIHKLIADQPLNRKPVVICCGKGNNGGDGFVIARHLSNAGRAVEVFLAADPERLTGDTQVNHRIAERMGLPMTRFDTPVAISGAAARLAAAAMVIDAVLGTGFSGVVRPPLDAVIGAINALPPERIVAIDVPSGLDCDTGTAAGPCVRAGRTITFVAIKRGFVAPGADAYTGRVFVADIGAPMRLIREIADTVS